MGKRKDRKGVKRIPVKGFVVSSPDGESNHSHKLYITSWDGRPVHVHPFAGTTSFDVGHDHQYAGMTEPAPSGVPHVHAYYAHTSFDDGHSHIIKGTTGPAIDLPGGGHVHHFEGYTTVNGRTPHTHMYRGTTGSEDSFL
ncbi:hypothetical protein SD70_09955 [Gordoniibacillus kamchatkensis]|uniref:YmaF family protein n=1 Tax=Gordoniibacillus kamchatkensis TaxID=1590651 RepID=A0ABR5AIU3_9BACL|nr:YmaF family protein [Paenibacillus sp. VKM B-2647]KIL40951.1 hypothetical protein SD70_09955 [Paenibacillus sp. VKM B-2647]